MPTSTDGNKKVDTAAPTKVKVGETKAQRPIVIERTRCSRFFEVKYEGGGEIAPELKGLFTAFKLAEEAVAAYKHRKGLA